MKMNAGYLVSLTLMQRAHTQTLADHPAAEMNQSTSIEAKGLCGLVKPGESNVRSELRCRRTSLNSAAAPSTGPGAYHSVQY